MRKINHRFPLVCTPPRLGDGLVNGSQSQSSYKVTIWSTARETLFWKNALGMSTHMQPELYGTYTDGVHVRIQYSFGPLAVVNPEGLLNEIDRTRHFRDNASNKKLKSDIQAVLNTIFVIGDQGKQGGYKTKPTMSYPRVRDYSSFEYELFIPTEELLENGGVIYLGDLDVIVGLAELEAKVPHPYSREGIAAQLLDIECRENEVTTQYYFVDNQNRMGPVWFHDGLEVRKLIPTQDPTMESGVYRTVRDGGVSPSKNSTKHYTDISPSNGFYATRMEAETLGSPDEVMKRQDRINELELKDQIKKKERDELEIKLQFEQEKRDWEKERRVLEDERREAEYREKIKDREDKEREREFRERMREKDEQIKEQERKYRLLMMERDERNRRWRSILDVPKTVKEVITGAVALASVMAMVYGWAKRQQQK